MSDEIDLTVEPDGTVRFVHDDRLVGAFDGERQETKRASHVEPHPTKTGWLADMRPSGGPVIGCDTELEPIPDILNDIMMPELIRLGHVWHEDFDAVRPFRTRQEALDAERAWLRKERGL
jgi:hypothetical protein